MVLGESMIMELSSFTESVTLGEVCCQHKTHPREEQHGSGGIAYSNWLGFFFFLRMAVAVSSSCGFSQYLQFSASTYIVR